MLYELRIGRVPYQADIPYAVIHDHIYAPLPLPRSIRLGFPESLERVLLKACGLIKQNERVPVLREFRQVGEPDALLRTQPWMHLALSRIQCRPEQSK